MMNESNSISASTKLYGYIAEKAQQSRFSVTLNRMFKASGDDAMMIPMNIREDDAFFTLSNMRRSHLKGAFVAHEYRALLQELLDEPCELCDFMTIRDEKLIGHSITPTAIAKHLEGLHVKRVAIIGATPLARKLAVVLEPLECSFYDPSVEALLEFSQQLGREIDINRIDSGMQVDLSGFDAVIDTLNLNDTSMITTKPDIFLKEAELLEPLCEATYAMIKEQE